MAEKDDDVIRDQAIANISNLYPPDAEFEKTAEIGKQDMIDALAAEWRTLPTPVLERMARRQVARDNHGY